jgi:sec-independent protein translocase protein TatA
MPGWLGPWEILIVVVIILLIFGGRLLPRLGRSLGGSVTGLKKGLKEGGDEFKTAIKEDEEAAKDVKVDSTAAQNPPATPTQTADGAAQPPADKTEQS